MNMFYTGLGIARSLGERGIPVIGLTAQRGVYGNYTRYAKTVLCPDSRKEPEALLAFLLRLAERSGRQGVLFPTRDDDVAFLDRFRSELAPHYRLVVPPTPAIEACLDKWQTYLHANRAGVATPKCWLIEAESDLSRILREATYPCVLKPLSARSWRQGRNWQIVGERKAIAVHGPEQLQAEYATVAQADKKALLQELIPGSDDCLVVTACYIDRNFRWMGAFQAQKLVQEPEGFGTGCIVQAVNRPEISEPARRLLNQMNFSGIAEVEYKWDQTANCYKLIEVNPRPWDQHRLGKTCGVDLIHLAYCDHVGLPMPLVRVRTSAYKWIADDVFVLAALRSLRRHNGRFRGLFRLFRCKRIYGIWSARDPLPFVLYFSLRLIPRLAGAVLRRLWLFAATTGRPAREKEDLQLDKPI
jgi:predicted ATP-grasp superfamily ATP-dependent carboligase